MSRVRGRRSPITGAVVIADIVVRPAPDAEKGDLEGEIIETCRRSLARHKVPISIRIVPALDILPTGKLARRA
jgi:acyl-CoA synthetase (AMP-forming)/AMP-acid ligase II